MGCLQAQRTRRNPRKNIWEELDQERLVRDAPDIEAILQQRAEVSVIQSFLGSALKITHCLSPSSATKSEICASALLRLSWGLVPILSWGSPSMMSFVGGFPCFWLGAEEVKPNLMHGESASSAVDSL